MLVLRKDVGTGSRKNAEKPNRMPNEIPDLIMYTGNIVYINRCCICCLMPCT